ncbi:MAG: UDP-2,4-diacetamido-2,4,6-trideoxy-beta-L-altropyranose hydrolase [Bacteroidetes bacterium]|nr:MAG: UDP-2,4-diacetamido-2,4,6-trideoxy-beta-L-altropyranose hydrolase [Bacteroidota bacterium]
MKPRILIRADGDSSVGLGHLVRCLALAQMLQEKFHVIFYCMTIPVQFKSEVVSKGFKVQPMEADSDFYSSVLDADIVVLDGYQFALEDHQKVKAAGALLVCIDDLHNITYAADVIINHCPGINVSDYQAEVYTQFALGSEYVLLRPKFLSACGTRRFKENPDAVMICFGGADTNNLTVKALRQALKQDWLKKIVVISGPAYVFKEELDALCISDLRVEHIHAADELTMLSKMLETDITIVPTSGVLLEALATGSRVVSGYFVDNHKFIYSHYLKVGAFIDAGDFSDNLIENALLRARQDGGLKEPFFDGHSGARIEKIFLHLKASKDIKLRIAKDEDLEQTYSWASNPIIRAYSFNQHEIQWPEHEQWFKKKVQDPNCFYFIAEKSNLPIGSIRFDITSENALISYLVDPAYHGSGYGHILLRNGLIALMNRLALLDRTISSVTGMVFKSNIASLKAFQRLGFESINEDSEYFTFRKLCRNEGN